MNYDNDISVMMEHVVMNDIDKMDDSEDGTTADQLVLMNQSSKG